MHRLVVALVALIGLVGAAFVAGYLLLFSAPPPIGPRRWRPATTARSTSTSTCSRPTGQQMNLGGLIGRLPGFADDASLDEKVDQVVQNLLGETGHRLPRADQAVARQPGRARGLAGRGRRRRADGVVIAEVKDQPAAEAAVADIAADGGETFTPRDLRGRRAPGAGGHRLRVRRRDARHRRVAEGDRGRRRRRRAAPTRWRSAPTSAATMDDLPADHLASAFVDLAALAAATGHRGRAVGREHRRRRARRRAGRAAPERQRAVRRRRRRRRRTSRLRARQRALEPGRLDAGGARSPRSSSSGCVRALEDAEAAAGSTPGGGGGDRPARHVPRAGGVRPGHRHRRRHPAAPRPRGRRSPSPASTARSRRASSCCGPRIRMPPRPRSSAWSTALAAHGRRRAQHGDRRRTSRSRRSTVPDVGEVAYAVTDGIVIIGLGVDDVAAALEAHADGSRSRASDAYARTFEVAGDARRQRGASSTSAPSSISSELDAEPARRRARYPCVGRDVRLHRPVPRRTRSNSTPC